MSTIYQPKLTLLPPLSTFVCIWLDLPPPSVRTSFMDDPSVTNHSIFLVDVFKHFECHAVILGTVEMNTVLAFCALCRLHTVTQHIVAACL